MTRGWRSEPESDFVRAILHNIEVTRTLFREGRPPSVVGTVCGSYAAQAFWQRQLDMARQDMGARLVCSFCEDLPVNQAFGLLLLWQRVRRELRTGEGSLFAFVFGEGTRAAPWTEAECGQKPAISSFVGEGLGGKRRYLSIAELALRYFAPVESFLRRSGFDGLVVKWGDEVQIPTLDLEGSDPRLAGADVVRFVSIQEITPEASMNKDWVGVDDEGRITAFIPRRGIEEMARLAARGLVQRRGNRLYGGVNLGSVALSRHLLDELLEEFKEDVNDASADRKKRPDLDPQLFSALTIAAVRDPAQRDRAWSQARAESSALRRLETHLPDVLERLLRTLDAFEHRHGRRPCFRALDFKDQYWGDLGQHSQIGRFYRALRLPGGEGDIARALAGLSERPDAEGNLISGRTRLGSGVRVRGSVLIDAEIESGSIEDSVLVGTRAQTLRAQEAFDVLSTASDLELASRSGSYKLVSKSPVRVEAGARATTVFTEDEDYLMRVRESTDLRDRASNYDRPILGNPMSFSELHQRVVNADPKSVHQRREHLRQDVSAVRARPSESDG